MTIVTAHQTAVVGPGVQLGENVKIGAFSVIHSGVRIGDNVTIGEHVSLGTPPEIRGIDQDSFSSIERVTPSVSIGNDCVIREHVTVQAGSISTTSIGGSTWLLSHAYVAHDAVVGEQATVSAGARLAGHVRVGAHANIGMNVSIHQHRVIGAGCMIGMGSVVTKDVPPLAKVVGVPATFLGINTVLAKVLLDSRELNAIADLYSQDVDDIVTELGNLQELRNNVHFQNWLNAQPSRAMTISQQRTRE